MHERDEADAAVLEQRRNVNEIGLAEDGLAAQELFVEHGQQEERVQRAERAERRYEATQLVGVRVGTRRARQHLYQVQVLHDLRRPHAQRAHHPPQLDQEELVKGECLQKSMCTTNKMNYLISRNLINTLKNRILYSFCIDNILLRKFTTGA